MSEYSSVEKPFLEKLKELKWNVINQGCSIPEDPTKSHRISFDDWALKSIFYESLKRINTWITDEQINFCYEK